MHSAITKSINPGSADKAALLTFNVYSFDVPSSAVTLIVILLFSPAFNSSFTLSLIITFALLSSIVAVTITVLTVAATSALYS